MVDINNLAYRIGKRLLFENVTLTIPSQAKVGIVGQNGCGKTTLFSLLLKDQTPDEGSVLIPQRLKVATVQQEIRDQDQSVLELVISSDKKLQSLLKSLETEHDDLLLADVYEELRAIDGYTAESRASAILSGLGFSQADMQKPLKHFSGGWQMRASLGACLFAPSDLLLLDEPTNHLDLETSIWLESYLEKTNKTLLIISHERHFLNRVCTHTLHIHNCTMKLYAGNYDTFQRTRAEESLHLTKAIEKQEKSRKHIQSFIDRFRYKASKAKQAQSRIKMLERMESLPPPPRDQSTRFEFTKPQDIDRRLVLIENGVAGYGDKVVLKHLNFHIDMGDRIAFLGENGAGKSTLSKIISQRLDLLSGNAIFARKVNIAYFSQQQADELDFSKTPFETLGEKIPDSSETQVRAQLARFGLNKEKGDTVIENLSGGEKTRLLLAVITRNSPHLLILDEPTNHLDIDARDALLDAINNYDGALILITHDFHFIEASCDQLYLIKDQGYHSFDGDIEDYKKELISSKDPKKPEKKEQKASNKEQKNKLREIKMEFNKVNRELNELTKNKDHLEAKLYEEYDATLLNQLEEIQAKLTQVEEKWFELSQQLENASIK